jgi:cyclase
MTDNAPVRVSHRRTSRRAGDVMADPIPSTYHGEERRSWSRLQRDKHPEAYSEANADLPLGPRPRTKVRIIPRLDVKGRNLVKGIHLEGLRVLGRPEDFAKRYYADGADELMIVDMVASLYGRGHNLDLVSTVTRDVFVPLTVGGGLRTLDDIRAALRAGADKVMLNTAAVKDPEFVRQAAETFGSSTIVVAIECVEIAGTWHVVTDCGRERTGLEAVSWARQVAELGAGEILVTSVDREGTGRGFALSLVKSIKAGVRCPVIAHGGCGSAHDMQLVGPLCDAVAVASVLHYRAVRDLACDVDAIGDGNAEFLRDRQRGFRPVKDCTVAELRGMGRVAA